MMTVNVTNPQKMRARVCEGWMGGVAAQLDGLQPWWSEIMQSFIYIEGLPCERGRGQTEAVKSHNRSKIFSTKRNPILRNTQKAARGRFSPPPSTAAAVDGACGTTLALKRPILEQPHCIHSH